MFLDFPLCSFAVFLLLDGATAKHWTYNLDTKKGTIAVWSVGMLVFHHHIHFFLHMLTRLTVALVLLGKLWIVYVIDVIKFMLRLLYAQQHIIYKYATNLLYSTHEWCVTTVNYYRLYMNIYDLWLRSAIHLNVM